MWLLGYALAFSAFAYVMWFAWTTFKPTEPEEPVRHNLEELIIVKIKSTKKAMEENDLSVKQYDCARTVVYTLTNILNDSETTVEPEGD